MTRSLLVVGMLLLAGCARGEQEEPAEEAEYAPIGPGSDSSALIPPDTPESRVETPGRPPSARDTLPR